MTLRDHGTSEQHKLFLEQPESYKIIGCYAQTELGHGSNVRGLETTATWSPEDQTFILHSPYLTASKWWIGGRGRTANHVVLMAQLIIDGNLYGPHTFVVQIRDMQTHQRLEGICVGDNGPKFGLNAIDNGYLLFNQVKIPHVNMLAKFARVDPETSAYIKPSIPSMVYSTLTYSRSTIVLESGSALARTATIAIRFTAGRVQFPHREAPQESSETQILNYRKVQYRLFPILTSSFALHFMGKSMTALHAQAKSRIGTPKGDELLADLHGISCSLKVFASTITAEGIETCRRAMGGHGFSSFSGLVTWYADYLPTVTWDGDNYVLTQQAARYLLKSACSILQGGKTSNKTTQILACFLQDQPRTKPLNLQSSDGEVVSAFAQRTSFLSFKALKRHDEEKVSWNNLLVDFQRQKSITSLLEDIRPHSVCLVDAWNFPDWQLNSSLGRKDGMVYEDLFYRASQLNPLNNLTVDPNPDSEILVRKDDRTTSKL